MFFYRKSISQIINVFSSGKLILDRRILANIRSYKISTPQLNYLIYTLQLRSLKFIYSHSRGIQIKENLCTRLSWTKIGPHHSKNSCHIWQMDLSGKICYIYVGIIKEIDLYLKGQCSNFHRCRGGWSEVHSIWCDGTVCTRWSVWSGLSICALSFFGVARVFGLAGGSVLGVLFSGWHDDESCVN